MAMKRIIIMEDVSIPTMPAFKKGQEVRIKGALADLLIERKHAKISKGKSREKMKKEKAEREKDEPKEEVRVIKTTGKAQ